MSRVVSLPLIAEKSQAAAEALDGAGLQAALRPPAFQGEVRWDRLSRALYSTDASVFQIVPLGVVLPKTEADIVTVVKACGQYRVPLTARGGGTSQAGQAIGPGLVLDCSKYFRQILEINAAERWVRVQPGCVLDDLNLALKPHGLQFAPDISTSNRATIGGMVANNSSGAHSLIYGKTVDHVLELRVVLADGSLAHLRPLREAEWEAKCQEPTLEGAAYRTVSRLAQEHAEEIDRRYPRILRRVGGYNLELFRNPSSLTPLLPEKRGEGSGPEKNLAHFFVGSEGTLGVTLEAKLRLVELPKAKALVVVHFHDLLESLAATPIILEHRPAAVEVTDRYILDSTKRNAEAARLRDFIQGDPGAILMVEFYAEKNEELPPKLQALVEDLQKRGLGYYYYCTADPVAQGKVWKLRKLSLGLSMLEKGDAKAISFVEDTAVAPEKLRDYIAEFLNIVRRHGTTAGVYAHASVGCLHVRPVINLKTEEGVQKFQAIAEEVADLVLKYDGALSGEHGDGLVRSPFQEKMFGPVLYQAFRQIKRALDPLNILNPGKIVDAPPLTQNLRYGPPYVTPSLPTTFDFSADGSLTQATELCAGVGECRKKREGSMCPSFRATQDEQHSTRGRANVLRLATTGQFGFQGLTDPAVKEVLDLCLECKACKSECPTNVDMARLKAEFLHQYYGKHGLPWRNWLFGRVAEMHRWEWLLGHPLLRSRPVRWLNEKLFGIDRRRLPPRVAPVPFTREPDLQSSCPPDQRWPEVILFPDTFANWYEPDLARAACYLLDWAGYRVELPPLLHQARRLSPEALGVVCCGRPLISNGMLTEAVAHARTNIAFLYPEAVAGKPIIACEPSCILTIKDDYPALLRGEERRQAEVVAVACQTFEEFMEVALTRSSPDAPAGPAAAGLSGWRFRGGPKRILVQAHCHQRSLVGMRPLLSLLQRIPGAEVIDLDAGCCGLAGSFGYEKEHYEVSRLVGEQRLFPALRAAGSDAVIVAPGFSCRMQIQHFLGKKAVHPAEVLASLISRK